MDTNQKRPIERAKLPLLWEMDALIKDHKDTTLKLPQDQEDWKYMYDHLIEYMDFAYKEILDCYEKLGYDTNI